MICVYAACLKAVAWIIKHINSDSALLIAVPGAQDSLLAVDQVMSRFAIEIVDIKETWVTKTWRNFPVIKNKILIFSFSCYCFFIFVFCFRGSIWFLSMAGNISKLNKRSAVVKLREKWWDHLVLEKGESRVIQTTHLPLHIVAISP